MPCSNNDNVKPNGSKPNVFEVRSIEHFRELLNRGYVRSSTSSFGFKADKMAVEFGFRLWVHPKDSDPTEIEVWYSGLESTVPGRGLITDWALESLSNEDHHYLFDLDDDKHWQVVGKGTLHGWYNYFSEYDEELDIIEYQKQEVPESWLYGKRIDK